MDVYPDGSKIGDCPCLSCTIKRLFPGSGKALDNSGKQHLPELLLLISQLMSVLESFGKSGIETVLIGFVVTFLI